MYIEEIRLRNFKNFSSEKAFFNKGVNVVIGENDSGKTNFMDAIRLVLDKRMTWLEKELKEDFFPLSNRHWQGHIIVISIIFNELNPDNEFESMFSFNSFSKDKKGSLTYFAMPKKGVRNKLHEIHDPSLLEAELNKITVDDYETFITAGLDIDYTDDDVYCRVIGDFSQGDYKLDAELDDALFGSSRINIELIKNDLINFTYIDALRDTIREMNQKNNPLMSLIKKLETEITPEERIAVSDKIRDLNNEITNVQQISKLSKNINEKIYESVGSVYSTNVVLKSDISNDLKDAFRNLKIKSDINGGMDIDSLGLGSNNVIYVALKLLDNLFSAKESQKYYLLLFEEPEAHLHKHLQMSLFEKTSLFTQNNVQIILSTHSDNISASSKIGSMNILQKNGTTTNIVHPTVGLNPEDIQSIERYLDVKRSELLFSKSVILVEGDAEEILIPTMVRKVLGLSFDEIGISLINIGSVGFENIYKLFNEQRIRKNCAILTDLDKDIDDNDTRGSTLGTKRSERIEEENRINKYVKGFFGSHTFEIELVPNNIDYYNALIEKTYSQQETIDISKQEISSTDASVYGKRALKIASYNGKGWNALMLSKIIDGKFNIPNYILEAIIFSGKKLLNNKQNLYKVLLHYADNYGDTNVGEELRKDVDQTRFNELLDMASDQDNQVIQFLRRVLL